MKLTNNTIFILLGLFILGVIVMIPMGIVAANVLAPAPQPTEDVQATLQAMVTQTVAALTQNAPTQTPVPATATSTPLPPTAIPATSTPLPTLTPVTYCDWAAFVADVTVPDGTAMETGEIFTKTWRIKNRGTCTWTPDYMLVFTSGDAMGGTTGVRLPGYVAPGQTVDVSVPLTAPSKPGRAIGYWMLRNPSGVLFGSGDKANKAFYVEIDVYRPEEQLPHGTVSGTISYPSEFNPPMTVYFQKVGTKEIIQFYVPENHMNFSFLLPVGTYYVYAWAPNFNLEGAYVNADGFLKPFTVYPGEETPNILISDWQPDPHQPGW